MKGIVDRFEGKYAVVELEGRKMVCIEIALLQAGTKEGDCIVQQDGIWVISDEETDARKKKIDKLVDDLFE